MWLWCFRAAAGKANRLVANITERKHAIFFIYPPYTVCDPLTLAYKHLDP